MAVALTVLLRAMHVEGGVDQTRARDHHADLGDPGVEDELSAETPAHAREA